MAASAFSSVHLGLLFATLAEEHGPAFEMVEGCVAFSDDDRTYTIEVHETLPCLLFNTAVLRNLRDLSVDQLAAALSLNHDPDFCAHGWLSPDLDRHEILLLGRCPTEALTAVTLWQAIETFVGFSGTAAKELASLLAGVASDLGSDEPLAHDWLRV